MITMGKASEAVEIFEIRNSHKLYQIAHTSQNQYILYKVNDPWYGFLNIIPGLGIKRYGQLIDEECAKKNMYKVSSKDYEKGQGGRVGGAMIAGVLINSSIIDLQSMNKLVIFSVTLTLAVVFSLIYTIILNKLVVKNNKLITQYKPDVAINLYSSYMPGRITLIFIVIMTLLPLGKLQLFLIAFFGFYIPPFLYSYFPDIKELPDTKNKIKISKIKTEK